MTALQALASGVVVLTGLLGVPLLLGLAGLAWERHRTPASTGTYEASPYVDTESAYWLDELAHDRPYDRELDEGSGLR